AASMCAAGAGAWAQCQGQWTISGSGFNGVVNAMVSWDPDGGGPLQPVLVAGGDFTMASGAAALHIAQWNGSSWQPVGTGIGGTFDTVTALAVFNNQLIAGGFFSMAGGG